MIENIFYDKAPLHDGAMVIRDGRIHACGCFLPLSGNPNLPGELGTRHRAAVGISEVSDAVVVVVSEETGAISVAIGGVLKRHLEMETLERLLRNELCTAEDSAQENKLLKIAQPFVDKLLNKDKGGKQK